MKSEHRHELKTNELAEWLSNLPQWARENLKVIIYVSVVAVVVIVAAFFQWYRKNVESVQEQLDFTRLITQLPRSKMQILQAQASGVDVSYMLIKTADELQSLAQNSKNDQMAALALIKRAEILRTELHYRLGTVPKQDIKNQINNAEDSYRQAIEKSSSNPTLLAAAKFGLGLCAEELGNFTEAGQIYRNITENAHLEGTTAATAAKLRLNTMADYQQRLVFKAAPAPVIPVKPQIRVTPPDANEQLRLKTSSLPEEGSTPLPTQ